MAFIALSQIQLSVEDEGNKNYNFFGEFQLMCPSMNILGFNFYTFSADILSHEIIVCIILDSLNLNVCKIIMTAINFKKCGQLNPNHTFVETFASFYADFI